MFFCSTKHCQKIKKLKFSERRGACSSRRSQRLYHWGIFVCIETEKEKGEWVLMEKPQNSGEYPRRIRDFAGFLWRQKDPGLLLQGLPEQKWKPEILSRRILRHYRNLQIRTGRSRRSLWVRYSGGDLKWWHCSESKASIATSLFCLIPFEKNFYWIISKFKILSFMLYCV